MSQTFPLSWLAYRKWVLKESQTLLLVTELITEALKYRKYFLFIYCKYSGKQSEAKQNIQVCKIGQNFKCEWRNSSRSTDSHICCAMFLTLKVLLFSRAWVLLSPILKCQHKRSLEKTKMKNLGWKVRKKNGLSFEKKPHLFKKMNLVPCCFYEWHKLLFMFTWEEVELAGAAPMQST